MAAADLVAVAEHRFRVMASEAHVLVCGPERLARHLAESTAPARLAAIEERWSRFVATSDLSRLTDARGEWCPAFPETIALVERMQEATIVTVGRYDPTLAAELTAAGYPTPDHAARSISQATCRRSVLDVEIDRATGRLRAPSGTLLDPGGIGKGFAADMAAADLVDRGAIGALVSIGGDLATAGDAPDDEGWPIVIEDPDDPTRVIGRIAIDHGGVATSSTRSRRWNQNGTPAHHVIDPATRRPSATDLATATVVAPTGWQAEVHATAALLEGTDGLIDYLDAHGLSGLGVATDGRLVATEHLAAIASVP